MRVGGFTSRTQIRNEKRACVHEWSSSRFVCDSETDIQHCLDAFLTHWIGARSIGPNCGASDGFGTTAHLVADPRWPCWRSAAS
jgi:hypothetical protein